MSPEVAARITAANALAELIDVLDIADPDHVYWVAFRAAFGALIMMIGEAAAHDAVCPPEVVA